MGLTSWGRASGQRKVTVEARRLEGQAAGGSASRLVCNTLGSGKCGGMREDPLQHKGSLWMSDPREGALWAAAVAQVTGG